MGVFEFFAIAIVSLSTASVIKAWFKRGSNQHLLKMQERLHLLESRQLDRRLDIIEEIVTGTSLEDEFARLEQGQTPRFLPRPRT